MKKNLQFALVITMLVGLVALPVLNQKGYAMTQVWVDPPTDTPVPTQVPWGWVPNNGNVVNPQNSPLQTTPEPARPLLYIADYHTDDGSKSVNPYGSFGLKFVLANNGREFANNIIMTFSSQDFDPLDGSVITLYEVDSWTPEDNGTPGHPGTETRTHNFKVNDMST